MILKNEQGVAMLLVLLSVTAAFWGATFLVNLGLIDHKITANKEKNIAALYMAEAGIEAALGLLLKHDVTYTGEVSSGFDDDRYFQVNISDYWGADGDKGIKLESTGTYVGTVEKIILQFKISPPLPPGTVSAGELKWFDYDTGLITQEKREEEEGEEGEEGEEEDSSQDKIYFSSGEPVYFKSGAPGNGLIVDVEGEACFSSPFFIFKGERSLEMKKGQLILAANEVVFYGELYKGEDYAPLKFSALEDYGDNMEPKIKVYLLKPFYNYDHEVLVPAGTYLFPSGMVLDSSVSVTEMEQYRISPIIPGSKKWL